MRFCPPDTVHVGTRCPSSTVMAGDAVDGRTGLPISDDPVTLKPEPASSAVTVWVPGARVTVPPEVQMAKAWSAIVEVTDGSRSPMSRIICVDLQRRTGPAGHCERGLQISRGVAAELLSEITQPRAQKRSRSPSPVMENVPAPGTVNVLDS